MTTRVLNGTGKLRCVELMNCRADYQGHTRVTFAERHTHLIPFCLPRSQCIVYSHKPKPKLVEPMSEST